MRNGSRKSLSAAALWEREMYFDAGLLPSFSLLRLLLLLPDPLLCLVLSLGSLWQFSLSLSLPSVISLRLVSQFQRHIHIHQSLSLFVIGCKHCMHSNREQGTSTHAQRVDVQKAALHDVDVLSSSSHRLHSNLPLLFSPASCDP